MGYLGNLLALSPGYADADVIVAHGDSLLLPLLGKPVIRVMHGSAREEARSATSIGRTVLQYGVYLQELLTARWQRGTVGVSENTRRSNRFVRRVIPNGVDLSIFRPDPARRSAMPSMLFVGTLEGRKRGVRVVRACRAHAAEAHEAPRPVTLACVFVRDERLEHDRRATLPLAGGVAVIRNARVGAAAGTGEHEQSGMALDERGQRVCRGHAQRSVQLRHHVMCLRERSFSRQISSINSASAIRRSLIVTVHDFV